MSFSEVPDKVIEEAESAGVAAFNAATRQRAPMAERHQARDRAFSEVIAGWARAEGAAEEREEPA